MKRSQFTYDRSLTDDLARVLSAAREHTWCEPQRHTLDLVIRSFIDEASDHDEHFDSDRFATMACYRFDRLPVAAPPDPTTDS